MAGAAAPGVPFEDTTKYKRASLVDHSRVAVHNQAIETLTNFFNRSQMSYSTARKYAENSVKNGFSLEMLLEMKPGALSKYFTEIGVKTPTFGVGENHEQWIKKELYTERRIQKEQLQFLRPATPRPPQAPAIKEGASIEIKIDAENGNSEDIAGEAQTENLLSTLRMEMSECDEESRRKNEESKKLKEEANRLVARRKAAKDALNKITRLSETIERLEKDKAKLRKKNETLSTRLKNILVQEEAAREMQEKTDKMWKTGSDPKVAEDLEKYKTGYRKYKELYTELKQEKDKNENLIPEIARAQYEKHEQECDLLKGKLESLKGAYAVSVQRETSLETEMDMLVEKHDEEIREMKETFEKALVQEKELRERFEKELESKEEKTIEMITNVKKTKDEQVSKLKKEIELLKNDAQDYKDGITGLQAENDELRSKKDELSSKNDKLSSETKRLELENSTLAMTVDKKETEVLRFKTEAEHVNKMLDDVENENEDLQRNLKSAQTDLGTARIELETAQLEVKNTRRELREERENLRVTKAKLGMYELNQYHEDLVSECLEENETSADDILDTCNAKNMNVLEHSVHGWTPLLCIAKSGSYAMVKYLVEQGANVNTTNNIGWTPLMWACWRGQTEMAEILLGRRAQINSTNREGQSALMLACSNRQIGTMKLLIDRGANVAICANNDVWQTALGIACRLNGHVFREFLNAVKVHGKENRTNMNSQHSNNSFPEEKHYNDDSPLYRNNVDDGHKLGTFWQLVLKIDSSLKGQHQQFIQSDGSWDVDALRKQLRMNPH